MNKVFKNRMVCSLFLILNGVLILICPIMKWTNFMVIFLATMIFNALINALQFFLNMETKDYTGALTCLSSLAIAIGAYLFEIDKSPKNLAITILIWTMFLSLIKLKKADMYHDRKSKLWTSQIFFLGIFMISGILTSINFLYGIEAQILIFGYFIFISGILSFLEPFLAYLTKDKLK